MSWPRTCVLLLPLLLACDDGDATPADGDAVADAGPSADAAPLGCDQPAPEVECPTGDLPFSLQSSEFEDPDTAGQIEGFPEFKDQNLDVLENPGAALVVNGRAARGRGLQSRPIADEWVSLWTWSATGEWVQLAREKTDDDGRYALPIEAELGTAMHPLYSVVEGLGECAAHVAAVWPAGTQVIVSDIDETLTTADAELIRQISDPSYDPAERPAASALINAWADKGYRVLYLTARPSDFRQPTRGWLSAHGYPLGPVSTADSLVFGDSARAYKGDFLKRVSDDLGWEIVAAYGNADSDIGAYEDAGIGKDVTFIIGESAGASDTQAVAGEGWAEHIASYVEAVPPAEQPFQPVAYCSE